MGIADINMFKERYDQFDSFFLYGATPAAVETVALLKKHGKKIAAFVDRDPLKQSVDFLGYPVIAPATFLQASTEAAGVIIVSAYQLEIYQYLIEEGIDNKRIFPHLDGMFFPTYGAGYVENPVLQKVLEGLKTLEEKSYFETWLSFKETGNYSTLKAMASIGRQYEHKAWQATIRPGGVCCDVGAYDGVSSIDFLATGLFDKVVALEPFAKNYDKLLYNIKKNKLGEKLEPRQIALGSCRETLWQNTEDVSSRARIVETDGQDQAGQEKIEVFPLDSLGLKNLTALKVDIEGFELAFLEGAKKTLADYRPHIAISAYHVKSHCIDIIKFFQENFTGFDVRIGHHPQAVYELEYYISFTGAKAL
ncbi:FkbM family methyltransferase [Kordiimonas pumila]|uniref:FkbM family methyltransferase n=1 Tax=Kordiimonas pumila TaxID=2161677 RepID=A0ABV7D264_9PROT|nr:FkbM family methyltransferase [Kordiimonas pumila]